MPSRKRSATVSGVMLSTISDASCTRTTSRESSDDDEVELASETSDESQKKSAVRVDSMQLMRLQTKLSSAISAAVSDEIPETPYDEHGFALSRDIYYAYRRVRLARIGHKDELSEQFARIVSDDAVGLLDDDTVILVRLGVPSDYRRAIWLLSSGAEVRMLTKRPYYRTLCEQLRKDVDGLLLSKDVRSEIDRDINRTLGKTILRGTRQLKRRMRTVLRMYALHAPSDGYCQAFNYFVMSFLVQRMTNEEAFWMLDHVASNLFPRSFDTNVTGQLADMKAFEHYFREFLPDLSELYASAGIVSGADDAVGAVCSAQMFGALLCDMMPYESVWCVWDIMFAYGAVEFFRALLKIMVHVQRELLAEEVQPRARRRRSAFTDTDEFSDAAVRSSATNTPRRSAAIKVEFRVEGTDAITETRTIIRQIVDMPDLLSRTRLPFMPQIGPSPPVRYKLDAAGLETRRNALRLAALKCPPRGRRKLLHHTSASSTSSDDNN